MARATKYLPGECKTGPMSMCKSVSGDTSRVTTKIRDPTNWWKIFQYQFTYFCCEFKIYFHIFEPELRNSEYQR